MEQPLDLPDDIAALRELVVKLQSEVQYLQHQKSHLQEQIRLLIHKRFGANSEKYTAEQADLFNEAEAFVEEGTCAENELAENEQQPLAIEQSNPGQTTVNKPGRKILPAELPRIEIIHGLPADQKRCPKGHALQEIGTEISEQLDIIPAKIQVLMHIRKKYACLCCGDSVKIAPMPPQPIPKSNASPNLLAFIAVGKFLDGLPLYRQSRQFDRIGVNLPGRPWQTG